MLPSIKRFHQVHLIKDQKSWSACVAIHNLYESKGNNGRRYPPKTIWYTLSINCSGWMPPESISMWNWTCYFVIFADNKWTKVGEMVNISWVCQNNVIKIESSIWAVRKIVWAHLFILERYQGTIFFSSNIEHPDWCSRANYTRQWQPQQELHAVSGSASMQ